MAFTAPLSAPSARFSSQAPHSDLGPDTSDCATLCETFKPQSVNLQPSGQGRGFRSCLNRLISPLIQRLKNVDGIDETAASMALIRGLTGPALAEAVFLGGFPFVVFGLMGMREECAEVKAQLDVLFIERADLLDQLNELSDAVLHNPGATQRSVQSKINHLTPLLQAHIRSLQQNNLPQATETLQNSSLLLAKLAGANDEYACLLAERLGAPFGAAAMTGMTVGMLPGIVWGGAEIAARALNQTSPAVVQEFAGAPLAAQVAGASGAAVSMAFAPANAAMVGYATFKALAGHRQCSLLMSQKAVIQNQLQNLEPQNDTPSLQRLVDQHIQAEVRSSKRTQGVYGMVTALSQSALTASGAVSIAAFAGGTAAASIGSAGIVIPVVGAAGAIAAAGLRIRGEIEQENRRGNSDAPTLRGRLSQDPDASAVDASPEVSDFSDDSATDASPEDSCFQPPNLIEQASTELLSASRNLAQDKITSLALKALEQFDTPSDRMQAMIQWVTVKGGKTGNTWGHGTTLLPETVEHMRALFYSPTQLQKLQEAFDQIDSGAARRCLLDSTAEGESVRSLLTQLEQADLLGEFSDKLTKLLVSHSEHSRFQESAPSVTQTGVRVANPIKAFSLRSQDKMLSILFKAMARSEDPKIREQWVAKAVRQTSIGWRTRLSKADRQQLSHLYQALTQKSAHSQMSLLQRVVSKTSAHAVRSELTAMGFSARQVQALAVQNSDPVTKGSNPSTVRPAPQGAGPFGLLLHQAEKHHYELDVERLTLAAEDSIWLNQKIHEIAVPMLSKALKNDSKVRFQEAFKGLVLGAESARRAQNLTS